MNGEGGDLEVGKNWGMVCKWYWHELYTRRPTAGAELCMPPGSKGCAIVERYLTV